MSRVIVKLAIAAVMTLIVTVAFRAAVKIFGLEIMLAVLLALVVVMLLTRRRR